jgi:hypothetical protein
LATGDGGAISDVAGAGFDTTGGAGLGEGASVTTWFVSAGGSSGVDLEQPASMADAITPAAIIAWRPNVILFNSFLLNVRR